MKIGQIVYFYYDNIIPCQKARIVEIQEDSYKIDWLNDEGRSIGSSFTPKDRVFKAKQESLNYYKALMAKKKNDLRDKLLTKEDVLLYMFNSIHSEDYDWSSEKEVLGEKISELFGINLNELS